MEPRAGVAVGEIEMQGVRTGRASPQLLENVQVHVQSYGSNMPINNLANITAPDARLLIVNPWDKSTIGDIERAIAELKPVFATLPASALREELRVARAEWVLNVALVAAFFILMVLLVIS